MELNAQKQQALTYLQRRQKTEDQISQQQLQYEVEDNKLQLEADLRETQRELTQAKRDLDTLKSAKALSSEQIIKQADLISGLEKGEAFLQDLIEELF